jgi:hypothetical protein
MMSTRRDLQIDRWLTLLCLLMFCAIGCSTQETRLPVSSEPAAAPAPSANSVDLSGRWVGRTITGGLLGMPGLIRTITLDLRQDGDKITGTYRCSSGKNANSFCRNTDEKGSVQGTAHGTTVNLNVMLLPDASNCTFKGRLDYNGNGQYTCYAQATIVEQGSWELHKVSDSPPGA